MAAWRVWRVWRVWRAPLLATARPPAPSRRAVPEPRQSDALRFPRFRQPRAGEPHPAPADRADQSLVPGVPKIFDVIQDVTQGTRRNADWVGLRSGPPTMRTSARTRASRTTGRLESLLIVAPYLSFIFGKKASPPSSGSGASGTEGSPLPRDLRFRFLVVPSSTPVTVSRPPIQ